MVPTTNLINARWQQARGLVKETWGKMSGHNGTRLEGQVERLSGLGQETLLQAEAEARDEIKPTAQRADQDVQQLSSSLVATANQVLGRPAGRGSSRIWIPVLGGAVLLTGLGVAVFTQNDRLRGGVQNRQWWEKLSTPGIWLKRC
jgi:uncharacterized protein YjbJ (UPF0337 family)